MYFKRYYDCGCGGSGAWQPAIQESVPASVRPADGAIGPMAPGYFSTWAGDQAVPADRLPPADPAPAE